MEDHEFCDSCPGCRPALVSVETGKRLPDDDPLMAVLNQVWDNQTTYAERRAFIEVTLKNSRHPSDLELTSRVIQKLRAAANDSDSDSEGGET